MILKLSCTHYSGLALYINNSFHLAGKYARIFVRGHYTVSVHRREQFSERSSRKTVSYEEQVIDDADWIGLSFKIPFKTRYHTSKR